MAGSVPLWSGPFRGLNVAGYRCIMADPAWRFQTYAGASVPQRADVQHYETMQLERIKALPVHLVAARDCLLLLWVIDSNLQDGLDVMRAWGFTYKTRGFTWVKVSAAGKPRMSMGYWTRRGSEICLLGTKGHPRRLSGGVREVIHAPIREHSRKPDEAYTGAQRLVGGPYLELFSREARAGWTSWGDQADKFTSTEGGNDVSATDAQPPAAAASA